METITTNALQEIRQKQTNTPIINVLDEPYYKKQHIPGSKNIPFNEEAFEQKVADEAGTKDSPVVVYCANEACDMSVKAAKALEQAGFEQVYDYEGGTEAWKEAGLPVESA